MEPWIIKYQPKNLSEIYGQNHALSELKNCLARREKRAAFLYGAPGCGKTASVYAFAKEFNYELIEVNASDFRNKDAIEQRLGNALSQRSLFAKEKIILVDEVDGIAGSADRGGLQALARLIDKSSFPIVMTANNPWDSKFSTLRRKSHMIEFRTLAYTSVKSLLKKICDTEGIQYDELSLVMLSRHASGDLRGAITDLQTISQYSKILDKKDVDEISDRRQTESIISALMRVLKTTNAQVALDAYENIEENFDDIFLWLDENLPKEYTEIADLAQAYDNISTADLFRGRIRRWQYWRFLVYIKELLSAGIAFSKREKYKGFTKYVRPTRILKIWKNNQKYAKRKAISEKIAKATHTSTRYAVNNSIPYLKVIFKKNRQMADAISKELELDKEEVLWLRR